MDRHAQALLCGILDSSHKHLQMKNTITIILQRPNQLLDVPCFSITTTTEIIHQEFSFRLNSDFMRDSGNYVGPATTNSSILTPQLAAALLNRLKTTKEITVTVICYIDDYRSVILPMLEIKFRAFAV